MVRVVLESSYIEIEVRVKLTIGFSVGEYDFG